MPTCSHKHARVKKTLFTQEKCCGALRGIIIMYPRAAWEECRQWTAVVRAAPLAGRLAFQLRALARGHGSSIYSYVGYALGKRSAKYSKPGVVFCFLLFPPPSLHGLFSVPSKWEAFVFQPRSPSRISSLSAVLLKTMWKLWWALGSLFLSSDL